MLEKPDAGDVASGSYSILSQLSTVQVNPDNTTTNVEQITFVDTKYGVTATFNVLASTYAADGAAVLVSEKAAQLEALVAKDHVVGARGEQDQDPATGRLYNYLVLTVGTDDFARTSEVRIRMDHLGTPAAFGAIAQAWKLIQNLGPTADLTV